MVLRKDNPINYGRCFHEKVADVKLIGRTGFHYLFILSQLNFIQTYNY